MKIFSQLIILSLVLLLLPNSAKAQSIDTLHYCGNTLYHQNAFPQKATHQSINSPPFQFNKSETCQTIQLALVADYSMVATKGSTANVTKYLNSIFEAVQLEYAEIGFDLQITDLHIIDCDNCEAWDYVGIPPDTTLVDPFILLDDFGAWGSTFGFSTPPDIVQLWTAKRFRSKIIGLANPDAACNDLEQYSVIHDYSPVFQSVKNLAAHEIAHNLGAQHDPITSNNIMRPSIRPWLSGFSPASTNDMTTYLNTVTCLNDCNITCPTPSELDYSPTDAFSGLLTWTASSTAYQLQWYVANETLPFLDIIVTNNTFLLESLSPCLDYVVGVQNQCSDGTWGTPRTQWIAQASLQDLAYEILNPSSMLISWNNDLPNVATQLQILDGENGSLLIDISTSENSFLFSNYSPCTPYNIKARLDCGNEAMSAWTIVDKAAIDLDNFQAWRSGENNLSLNWTASNYPIHLLVAETASNLAVLDTVLEAGATDLFFDALSPCLNYTISATLNCGDGQDSPIMEQSILSSRAYFLQEGFLGLDNIAFLFLANNFHTYHAQLWDESTNTLIFDQAVFPFDSIKIGDLQACQEYLFTIAPFCDTLEPAYTLSRTITTKQLDIQTISLENCTANNQSFDLWLTGDFIGFEPDDLNLTVNNGVTHFPTYATTDSLLFSNIPIDAAENLNLTLASQNHPLCVATTTIDAPHPACACRVIFEESFDNGQLPIGWKNTAFGSTDNARWAFGFASNNQSLDSTKMAFFDDDIFDQNGGEAVRLSTPCLDLSHFETAQLTFDYNLNTISGYLLVRVWNGTQWNTLDLINEGDCGFWGCSPYPTAHYDLTPYLNEDLQIDFGYYDGNAWDWYVGIDDVQICAFEGNDDCHAEFTYFQNDFTPLNASPKPFVLGNQGGTFSSSSPNLIVDSTEGTIDLVNSVAGDYWVYYTSPNGGNCMDSVPIRLLVSHQIAIRATLEGAYNGTNTANTSLWASDLLPLNQPFKNAPYFYEGVEYIPQNVVFSATPVDWILLELRWVDSPDSVLFRQAVLLLENGDLTPANGSVVNNDLTIFLPTEINQAFVVVRHLNHLDVVSNAPIFLNAPSPNYDFTTNISQAMGSNQQVFLPNGIAVLRSGDIDGNGVINITDFNDLSSEISLIDHYSPTDLNLDGNTSISDFNLFVPNASVIGVEWVR